MEQSLLLAILERANTGLMVVSQQSTILFCNHWLQSRCQLTPESVKGAEITRVFPRFSEARIAKALSDALQYGITSTLSHTIHDNIFPLTRKSGDPIHHAVLIQAIQGEAGNHALIEVTDVTSSIKRERSIRLAQQRSEEAVIAKEEFLASMSHELRTPLTTIIGNSELLAEQEVDPLKHELIHSIEIAGRGQLALVNDILDMSKMGSGKFSIDPIPFNLSTLLHEIQYLFSARISDQGLTLEVQQPENLEQLIIGDAQRIQQILINLMGNALKFTAEGQISITASIQEETLSIQVQDSGIGIEPEVMERIFQRFEQADSSTSRRFGGSGLGLYISHSLASLMGGSIQVESELNQGSTFTLRIPCQISDISTQSRPEALFDQSSLTTRLSGDVLVVEDTQEIQLLIKRILQTMGITVITAENGKVAVERASSYRYDAILMDMQMPEMDGIEATRTLREQGIETPIVALTANVMQHHRDAFTTAGCNDFLSKPIDKLELQQTLKRYLKEERAPVPLDTEETITDEALMQLFTTTCAERRNTLINAFARKEWSVVRNTAHTIKGGSASFGHPELTQLSKIVCDLIDQEQQDQIDAHIHNLISALSQIQH